MDRNRAEGKGIGKRGGFTLVELAVVMAIIGMLGLAAGSGLWGYYRYGEWKKRNEYAKTLFLAVQSELIKRSQSGQLSDAAGLWETENGGICCLEGIPEDYLRYREGKLLPGRAEDEKILALYGILEPYIADKSLFLEGAVRVELKPEEGLVFRCYYGRPEDLESFFAEESLVENPLSEKSGNPFAENLLAEGTDGSWEERLRKMGIGCYQTESLPAGANLKVCRPEIRHLRLWRTPAPKDRKSRIGVSWQIQAEDTRIWKELSYQITVYAGEDELCRILLNPEGEEEDSLPGGYGGIPKGLWVLDGDGETQIMQAVFCRDGKRDWCCLPVSLEESGYEITCILEGEIFREQENRKEQKKASFSNALSLPDLSGLWELPDFSSTEDSSEPSDISESIPCFSLRELLLEDGKFSEDGDYVEEREISEDDDFPDEREFWENGDFPDGRELSGDSGFSEERKPAKGQEFSGKCEIKCTVVGYGRAYAPTAMKESNAITLFPDNPKENNREEAVSPEEDKEQAISLEGDGTGETARNKENEFKSMDLGRIR